MSPRNKPTSQFQPATTAAFSNIYTHAYFVNKNLTNVVTNSHYGQYQVVKAFSTFLTRLNHVFRTAVLFNITSTYHIQTVVPSKHTFTMLWTLSRRYNLQHKLDMWKIMQSTYSSFHISVFLYCQGVIMRHHLQVSDDKAHKQQQLLNWSVGCNVSFFFH